MDGRGYSEFYRNTSEELFLKSMMESSLGMPAPTMDMLGFKNHLTQNFRTDSEELFKSWLSNGENNGGHSSGIGHRPQQASRRISTELASLANQNGDILFPQTTSVAADCSNDLNSTGNGVDKGLQASNLFLAKAWFHSSQPMTRSRSSELRRRYAAMQNSQTQTAIEPMYELPENPNQFTPFISPSDSSSSMFHNQQMGSDDKISSVVCMLKGTLERKKLSSQIDNEALEDSFRYYTAYENQETLQDVSMLGARETEVLQTIEESLMEDVMCPVNRTQMSIISREPSQSESSAAPAIVSNGFDMCDDPQAPSVCESSRNQMGIERSPENCSITKDFRERIQDNVKDDQKKGRLIRYGSITSAGSVDRGDPTKKRRVERSRKMAEAKERSSSPAIPSDMHTLLKRCENLEKEVRSLKLNLAFMNRKDSEQTKQIEELQKQNHDLTDEKERLLEEIERIIAETGTI